MSGLIFRCKFATGLCKFFFGPPAKIKIFSAILGFQVKWQRSVVDLFFSVCTQAHLMSQVKFPAQAWQPQKTCFCSHLSIGSCPFSSILTNIVMSPSVLLSSSLILCLTSKLKISTISLYICLLFGPRSHGLVVRAVTCDHEVRGPGFNSSSDQMFFFSWGIWR